MKVMKEAAGTPHWKKLSKKRKSASSEEGVKGKKGKKKTGFRVGPKPAPGVYTGKGTYAEHCCEADVY